jgi:t-SNARE complex subunit (syntaxin)
MSKPSKRALARKRAAATEKKFFKYAIIATIVLVAIMYLLFKMNN